MGPACRAKRDGASAKGGSLWAMDGFVAPTHLGEAFTCPSCSAYSHQYWYAQLWGHNQQTGQGTFETLSSATCAHCGEVSVWVGESMVAPDSAPVPMPNPDLPGEIQKDYLEARSIFSRSPRGAAALLRLSIQKLVEHLGEPGKDLNTDIGALVKRGLLPQIQQALDAVRVVGNNAVHPGEIDLQDTPEIAQALFGLVNAITEQLISYPKQVQAIYQTLPPGALEGVERRDKESKPKT